MWLMERNKKNGESIGYQLEWEGGGEVAHNISLSFLEDSESMANGHNA